MGRNRKDPSQLAVTVTASLYAEHVRKLKRMMDDRQMSRSAIMQEALDCLYSVTYPNETNSNPTDQQQ